MKCPAGHESSATDYCDTCGEAMPAPGTAAAPPVASGETPAPASVDADAGAGSGDQPCPNCALPNPPDALFCENCGYDHTTGTMPRREDPSAATATAEGMPSAPDSANVAPSLDPPWVAEIWIDPQWYGQQESPDPLPSPGPPTVVALRHTSLLIGRLSQSRGITPDIDCGADNGVSRRHAQLTTDGTRWWVEDLQSSNGTFVGEATSSPPDTPISGGAKREVDEGDRIYVGSWTRIVIRPAADGEV